MIAKRAAALALHLGSRVADALKGRSRRTLGLGCLLLLAPSALGAQQVRDALPLEVAVSVRGHNGRSPINFSPDGQWIAHTVQSDENVPRDTLSWSYSATGFPFAEGDARMEAMVTHTVTGEAIRLGGASSSSWAPVWSPDGSRVAFYSDEGGEAGLWVWELATRRATRVPGIIVRPYFGFDGVRWSADGDRLLVKVLPAGQTIAEANALSPRAGAGSVFPEVKPGQPSVHVRRFEPGDAAGDDDDPDPVGRARPVGDLRGREVDLSLVDLRTGTVARLVESVAVSEYAFSPDERHIAYTVTKGWEENSQQPNFDLMVVDARGTETRRLAENIRLGYGIEWGWSPDGRSIGYFASGQLAEGDLVLVPAAGGRATVVGGEEVPRFAAGEGEVRPLWDSDGGRVYGVAEGDVWRVDVRSGQATRLADVPGWEIQVLVGPYGASEIWSTDGGGVIWAVAAGDDGRSGILSVDAETGAHRIRLEERKSYSGLFSLSASDATGEIAFVSTDQQHLPDVWLLDTRSGRTRQATRLNPDLERFEMGVARTIEWRGRDGEPLRGALLLPPGYAGERLPLVVFVYGGARGSTYVNRFGFWGSLPTFNMHVLATRGFAVLYPDAPLREGRTMTDILEAVMPGVDAAIEQGYADPERLAVMGQSYGSFNTLSIITQTDRFRAAVITAAVLHPDLFADYLEGIGYYEEGQGNMGGSIWEYPDRYRDNSPLFLFDRISTPLLIGQGERDGDLVPSEGIFAALQRLEKAVEYRLYQGEGHVITQKANVLDFWQRRLEFLAEHLDLRLDGRHGRVVLHD